MRDMLPLLAILAALPLLIVAADITPLNEGHAIGHAEVDGAYDSGLDARAKVLNDHWKTVVSGKPDASELQTAAADTAEGSEVAQRAEYNAKHSKRDVDHTLAATEPADAAGTPLAKNTVAAGTTSNYQYLTQHLGGQDRESKHKTQETMISKPAKTPGAGKASKTAAEQPDASGTGAPDQAPGQASSEMVSWSGSATN